MNQMNLFDQDFTEETLEIDETLLTPDGKTNNIVTPEKSGDDTKDKDDPDKTDETVDDTNSVEIDENTSPDKSDSKKDNPTDSSSDSNNFLPSLVKALVEGEVIKDVDETKIKTVEDFYQLFEDQIKQREFSDLTDRQKQYLEAIRVGIPEEDVVEHLQLEAQYNQITDEMLAEESDDAANLRRDLIMNNFILKGFTEDKAKKQTDRIFAANEDLAESKDALNELKQYETNSFTERQNALKQQEEAAKEANRQAIENLNKLATETKEVIPGIRITTKLRADIVKGLTQPVAYTEDNKPLDIISKYLYDNPVEGRFKLAYLLKATNELKDLSKVTIGAKNKAIQELAKAVNSKGGGNAGGSIEFKDGESNELAKIDWDKFDLA